jgi:dihydrofolate reductase
MRKVVSLMHASLDGFVATPAGELDWISYDNELQQHVDGLMSTVDTALYGRVTYQMMESYWPTVAGNPESSQHDINHANWVEQVHKVVISRSLDAVTWSNTNLVKDNIKEAITNLKQQSGEDIMIFGSPSITRLFTELDLIDVFYINVNPVILGSGNSMFSDTRTKLKLQSAKTLQSGVLGLQYAVAR